MSIAQPQTKFGNSVADMFGIVSPEDRSRWQAAHQQRAPKVSAFKEGLKAGIGSLLEFQKEVRESQMDAVIKSINDAEFKEAYDIKKTDRIDPESGATISSFDYARNEREVDIEHF